MLNLITDRTQADVTAVATTKGKFAVVNSVGSYISIADLGDGKYLVFKGTQSELNAFNAGMKGAWNYTDMNRLANAMRTIVNEFNAIGQYPSIVAKNDWAMSDIPTVAQALQFIADLTVMKQYGMSSREVPESMNGMTYETANRIESIINDAYLYAISINGQYNHCGTVSCGGEGVLA